MLISLVYVSRASHDLTEEELLTILDKSRKNNTALGITGMLLYRDRVFIQALEGEVDKIKTLYEKIAQDTRHRDVKLVSRRPIRERTFQEWSMGFKNLDNVDPKDHPGFVDFFSQPAHPNYFEGRPDEAHALLDAFK